MFNDDFTDFENQDWNGWVAEADRRLQIVSTPDGYCVELPRQVVEGTHRLIHKRLTGLTPGKHYLLRLRVRQREDMGTGIQHIGLAVDTGTPQWWPVAGLRWQRYSVEFTATTDSHEVSVFFEHKRFGEIAGGNFHLDNLRFEVPGDSLDDLTDFEKLDPLNRWYREANGHWLEVLKEEDGNQYLGHFDSLPTGVMGSVLSKGFLGGSKDLPGTFSLSARKAKNESDSRVEFDVRYAGQKLGVKTLSGNEWQRFEWSFNSVVSGLVSILVSEPLEIYAAGLWIDDLLIFEIYEHVADFSGGSVEDQFKGWELRLAGAAKVIESAEEGHVLDFPTAPGGPAPYGVILSLDLTKLMLAEGARYEFVIRARTTDHVNPTRFSVQHIYPAGPAIIRDTPLYYPTWQPRDQAPRLRGVFEFCGSAGLRPLQIFNNVSQTQGNDFQISELSIRRIDWDE